MRKKSTLGLFRFLFATGSSLILLIVLNFTPGFFLVNTALIIIIMFFLPGYSLVNILFEKKPEVPEFLVLSVGISIVVFILIAMGVHLSGARISVVSILNPVALASLILGSLDFLKNVLLKKNRVEI